MRLLCAVCIRFRAALRAWERVRECVCVRIRVGIRVRVRVRVSVRLRWV